MEVPLGIIMIENTFEGLRSQKLSSLSPKYRSFKPQLRQSTTFQRCEISHLLIMEHYQKIDATVSEYVKVFRLQHPLVAMFVLVCRFPLFSVIQ